MLIKGPFTLRWGSNEILDVEEIDFIMENRSEEYVSNKGVTYELDRSHKVGVMLTLLSSDIAVLAVLLPQHIVPENSSLTSGETVTDPNGAFEFLGEDCDDQIIYNNLEIIPCSDDPQVTRIINARSKVDGIINDGKVQKVRVKLLGEATLGQGALQMFKQGQIEENILILGDNDPFFLGGGENEGEFLNL